MESVQGHIDRVLTGLEADPTALIVCLSGLQSSQDGQLKLSSGRSQEALSHLLEARDAFQKVPSARYMLGITNADIAAAYANLRNFSEAVSHAHESIALLSGNPTFAETEANAHMTLANALSLTGRAEEASAHYEAARRIYLKLPNSQKYLRALEQNMSNVLATSGKEEKKGIGCLLMIVIVIAAVYLLFRH
jgi:tetratricopeptide (TPR) repeat protein